MKTDRSWRQSLNIQYVIALILTFALLWQYALPPVEVRASRILPPLISSTAAKAASTEGMSHISEAVKARASQAYGKLPIMFEPNEGQLSQAVKFRARGATFDVTLGADDVTLQSASQMKASPHQSSPSIVRMRLLNANKQAEARGEDESTGKVNYFIGDDKSKWRTDIATYSKVRYREIYNGVDALYYSRESGALEYDFIVAPQADYRQIALRFDDARSIRIDARSGDLVLQTRSGEVRQKRPEIYQEMNGERQTVAGEFILKDKRTVGFRIGDYDHAKPLVIDPTIIYSTYLGGAGGRFGNGASAIAVDSSGNIYITGYTDSPDFTSKTTFGSNNISVAKISADGQRLLYLTFLGGSNLDLSSSIAVDPSGNAYITGVTASTDYPTLNQFQKNPKTGGTVDYNNAFVTKLNPAGDQLIYSTYLGGSIRPQFNYKDIGYGIAVDSSGNAYVTGTAGTHDFPLISPIQSQFPDSASSAAFVAKFGPSGQLTYSTFLTGQTGISEGSGSGAEGRSIAVDTSGNIYVYGSTNYPDFPTKNSIQSKYGGFTDAFVTKISADGQRLIYSTYLGGRSADYAHGIAVDSSGNAYVTGETSSTNFPTKNAIQPTSPDFGGRNCFITKIDASGGLVFSTYLGGGSIDVGHGIGVDSAGNVYVAGFTSSTDFPTKNALQSTFGRGSFDAFITMLSTDGQTLIYSTYLGGKGDDTSPSLFGPFGDSGIAVDSSGNVYIAGATTSTDFPIKNPLQATINGKSAAFITKISAVNPADDPTFFVTQHYRDFLNRAPDQAGLNFWTGEINSCGGDAKCIDIKRQNVSAAYFLSREFQETGFYVIKLQRVAFGRVSNDATKRITLSQFSTDAAAVGKGFVDLQPGADQVLDQNKTSYAQSVAGSQAFIARFPTTQSAAQFVDALFQSAGVTPQGTERQDAINAFGAGDVTGRAASLRKVAESNSIKQAEFSPAFVLLQYFGYLRRNPTDAPDTSDAGYQFWLAKLTAFNGDYIRSEMVRSFIVSQEYRKRFGAN